MGLVVRQSDLASYSRCAQQKKLNDLSKAGAIGPGQQLSMTAYGSVLHHGVHVLEKLRFEKRKDALAKAHSSFEFYWDPVNIAAICPPVTIWAARQTYAGLLRKGHQTLDLYAKYLEGDRSKLLALEIEFNLPFELDGEQHVLHGTMDRLALRKDPAGVTYVECADFKSGQDYKYLRWNAQFTLYLWSTTQHKFWADAWGEQQGEELYQRFALLGRRGTWVSLRNGVDRQDAGWRGPKDYDRLWVAIREYIKAVKADIYPLSLTGAVCEFCNWREICGGVAVPDHDHGRPESLVKI